MSQEKYIGMDVHQASISVAVMDAGGKLIMECLLETKASTIVQFIQGLQGTLSVTFEEGTSAAWLHDLLKPHVSRLVVCDPRKAALLKEGNKSDRIDARKLAELLRTNQLKPIYHEEHGIRGLKELGRSYLTITKDVTRVMNRIKALYRSWGIACSGAGVYAPRHRAEWLAKLVEPGVRVRAEHLYQQLDSLQPLRLEARGALLRESYQHPAVKLLRQIPSIGPIGLPCWWPCCRHPSVFVPSGSSGPTVVSLSRLTTAASTAGCEANCNATASALRCAVSMTTTTKT